MKYAKQFKVVPYSTETPSVSQLPSTFNNAFTKNISSDKKVIIYNQALSRIKDLTVEIYLRVPKKTKIMKLMMKL